MRPGGKARLPRDWGSTQNTRAPGPSGEMDSEGLGRGGLVQMVRAPPRPGTARSCGREAVGGGSGAHGEGGRPGPGSSPLAAAAGGGPAGRGRGPARGGAAAARAASAGRRGRGPQPPTPQPEREPRAVLSRRPRELAALRRWDRPGGARRCRDRRQRRCRRLAAALSGSAVGKWLPRRFLSSPGCLLPSEFNRRRRSRGEGRNDTSRRSAPSTSA